MKSALSLLVLICLLCAHPALALKRGDAGQGVLSLQTSLLTLGYLETEPNGEYGDQTVAAVERLRAYCQAAGVSVGGEPGEATDALLTALTGSDMPLFPDAVRPGDKSEAVLRVQRRLRVLGYLTDAADGFFGDNTARALTVFQHTALLALSGYADRDALCLLFSDAAPKAPYAALARGSKGDSVLRLQTLLAQYGFFIGDLDGFYGDDTVLGVKALEQYVMRHDAFSAVDPLLRSSPQKGLADPYLISLLEDGANAFPTRDLQEGDTGLDVYRLQRRLFCLLYQNEAADGAFGARTTKSIRSFQKNAGLTITGRADAQTLTRLYQADAPAKSPDYRLRIDLSDQTVTILQRGKNGGYKKVAAHFACSTGASATPTPTGTYEALVRPMGTWTAFDGYVGKYAFRLKEGLYLLSIPYDQKDGVPDYAYQSTLGQAVTNGNIYLSEANAYLIWSKCTRGTQVAIVD